MITHELDLVYITSDGKRFLDKDKAEKYEEKYQKELQDIERLQNHFTEVFKQFP